MQQAEHVGYAHVVRVVGINGTIPYDSGSGPGSGNWTHVLVYDPYTGTVTDTVINETVTPPTGNTPGKKLTFIFWWGVWAYLEDQVNLHMLNGPRQRGNTIVKPEERREELNEVIY